jgi:hypothetical protein
VKRKLELVGILVALTATIGAGYASEACAGAQGSAVGPTISLAVCVLGVVARDWGKPAAEVAADAIATCGSDAVTLAPLLDEAQKVVVLAHASCPSRPADAGH